VTVSDVLTLIFFHKPVSQPSTKNLTVTVVFIFCSLKIFDEMKILSYSSSTVAREFMSVCF
jgi:hypothetical protein